jgi:hypothetical protein
LPRITEVRTTGWERVGAVAPDVDGPIGLAEGNRPDLGLALRAPDDNCKLSR